MKKSEPELDPMEETPMETLQRVHGERTPDDEDYVEEIDGRK